MKKVLLAAAVALTLAGCGKTGNKDAEADKNVSMFRSEEVVAKKQLSLPDSLNFYGKDAKVFTETTVSVCWPETLGGKEPKELQDSILSIAFGTSKRATLKESLEAMLAEPLGFEGEKGITQKDVDKLPELSETVHRHSAQLTVTPTSIGKRLVTYSVFLRIPRRSSRQLCDNLCQLRRGEGSGADRGTRVCRRAGVEDCNHARASVEAGVCRKSACRQGAYCGQLLH